MTDEEILNVISKTEISLGGMTINERLFVCGLMEEFDKAKIKDKTKAKRILELLNIDQSSIKQILKGDY